MRGLRHGASTLIIRLQFFDLVAGHNDQRLGIDFQFLGGINRLVCTLKLTLNRFVHIALGLLLKLAQFVLLCLHFDLGFFSLGFRAIHRFLCIADKPVTQFFHFAFERFDLFTDECYRVQFLFSHANDSIYWVRASRAGSLFVGLT
ncbi:MAG: hypothetical protein CMN82_12985 [Spongiibacter sp.]|nr:hypothetical protein [Spongiibacter sp.]